MPSFIQEI